jgi:hypothetical protein
VTRAAVFRALTVAVVAWSAAIVLSIVIAEGIEQSAWEQLLVVLLGAAVGAAHAVATGLSRRGSAPWGSVVLGGLLTAISVLLLLKLVRVLNGFDLGDGAALFAVLPPMIAFFAVGFGLLLRLTLAGPAAVAAPAAAGMPARSKPKSLEEIVISDPSRACPICRLQPRKQGHVLLQCYACGAEFCSRHLRQFGDRCRVCRTPVPFVEQLRLFIPD